MNFLKKILLSVAFFLFSSNIYSQELNKFFPDKNNENSWANISNFTQTELTGDIKPEKDLYVSVNFCPYPNENIYPGKDLLPAISDKKRINALLELLKKISKCVILPFKEDGQIFRNKEGLLPQAPLGYYREYTLIIPKDADKQFYIGETQYTALPSYGARGPERIVIGDGKEVYYTPTHYKNFVKMEVLRIDIKNSEQIYTTSGKNNNI